MSQAAYWVSFSDVLNELFWYTHIYILARQILFSFIFGILMEHGPASVGSLSHL